MDRYKVIIVVLFAMIFSVGTEMSAQIFPLDGTKHYLSSIGTGSYRAKTAAEGPGGTTEICIFCHTPHSGNAEAPLWNRVSNQVDSYATYTSDVLAGLGYWAAEDPKTGVPHSKTRICLSCHDGTIALGSVVNMPNNISSTYTEIQMFGNSKIQQSAPGYIGIDLRDDHPVAIKHDPGRDTELVTLPPVAGGVRLYNASAVAQNNDGNFVECTSCHNPHDNINGKFLIETNKNSALCERCHDKEKFSSSAHADSSINVPYAPATGGTPPNQNHGPMVGDVRCMNCHFPHKAGLEVGSLLPNTGYGRYLLSYREENSCFVNNPSDRWGTSNASSACHGSGGAKNIESDIKSSSKHPIIDSSNTSPRHKATEAQSAGWFNNASVQHTECEDCHNPHTSGKTAHISPVASLTPPFPPALTNSSPIYGVGGVNVNFPGNWGVPNPATAYTYVKPIGVTERISTGADTEYKICFKCHTAYAWTGGTAPNSSSLLAPVTDQAQEFNPNNLSFHPVVQGNTGHTAGSTGLTGGWNNGNQQTMYCSDCHTRSGGGTPQGAHGSSKPFILAGTFEDTYGTAGGSQHQSTSGLCSACHLDSVYSTPTLSVVVATSDTDFRNGSNHNLHNQHRYKAANIANKREYRCVNCHVRIPHGWQRDALIVLRNDGAPYEAGGVNTGLITSWTQQPGSYTAASCGSGVANGVTGCHP